MPSTPRDHIVSELLLVRYQRGDASALNELVTLWQDRLFYYIRRLVGDEDDAWDALQETWFALMRNAEKLRDPRSLVMWLYKIARHKAIDKLRGKYRARALSLEPAEIEEIENPEDSFTFEDADQVHCALRELSDAHREVLTLFFLEDLSLDEIAGILETATGTVKSRLHFARKALRAAIEKQEATG